MYRIITMSREQDEQKWYQQRQGLKLGEIGQKMIVAERIWDPIANAQSACQIARVGGENEDSCQCSYHSKWIFLRETYFKEERIMSFLLCCTGAFGL